MPLQQRPAWWFGKVRPINQLQISIFFALVHQRFSWTGFISWRSSHYFVYMSALNYQWKKSNWHPETRPLLWPSSVNGDTFSHLPTTEQTFAEHTLCSRPHAQREYQNRSDSLPYITSSLLRDGVYTNFFPQTFWHELYFKILSFVYTVSPFQHLSSELLTFPKSNPYRNPLTSYSLTPRIAVLILLKSISLWRKKQGHTKISSFHLTLCY